MLLATSQNWQQGADSVCWSQRVTKRVLQVPYVAKLGLSKVCTPCVYSNLCSCAGQAPIKLLFPAAPKLVAAALQPASAPALATAALAPWLAAKGIRSAQEIDAVAAANR